VQFTHELQHLSKVICAKLKKPLANIHFDFECYDHGTIHSTIAGLCNAKSFKPGFENLKLHLLSCFDLDDIHKFEERKREYTASNRTLEEIIEFSNSLDLPCDADQSSADHQLDTYPYKTLRINESQLITSHDELSSFMKESVRDGFEGLVVYPLDNHYRVWSRSLVQAEEDLRW